MATHTSTIRKRQAKSRATKRSSKQRGLAARRVRGGRKTKLKRRTFAGYQSLTKRPALRITSPQQFIAKLEELRTYLVELRRATELPSPDVRWIEETFAEVTKAMKEAKKPRPLGERINQSLDSASDTMSRLGKSVGAAIGLGTVLAGLGLIALKLFGG